MAQLVMSQVNPLCQLMVLFGEQNHCVFLQASSQMEAVKKKYADVITDVRLGLVQTLAAEAA